MVHRHLGLGCVAAHGVRQLGIRVFLYLMIAFGLSVRLFMKLLKGNWVP